MASRPLCPRCSAYGSADGPWWEQDDWNAVFPFDFLVVSHYNQPQGEPHISA